MVNLKINFMKKFLSVEINTGRIYGLDILRALAILFVVVGHGKYLLPSQMHQAHKIFVFDGVSIFFVLSGFLIGGILIKLLDANQPTKQLIAEFWIRRWFRTLPNYFLILFLLLGFSFLNGDKSTIYNSKSYFIFSQNLFYQHPKFFLEAWSLSVEEWFYLITPLSIFLLTYFFKIKARRAILFVAIAILILVLFFRFLRFSHVEVNSVRELGKLFARQVITRLDSLMYGVISAYIQFYYKTAWLKYKTVLLFLGILIFTLTKTLFLFNFISDYGFYNCVLSFSVISIATAFLLPYLSDLKSGNGILYKGITVISLISYSMYLLNLSVVQLNIINKIPWKTMIDDKCLIIFFKYSAYWIFTILGAILIYKYFEIPTTRLRDNNKIQKFISRILRFK